MYSDKVVGANIKNARLLRNYSQDYLAQKLNMSQNAFSKLELGYTRVKLDTLLTVAKVLQVEFKNLIEPPDLQADLLTISRISIVPKLLEVICRTTGMGFAAVARVTDDRWIACSVRDEIEFGLVPGSQLKLETTICNEIRQHGRAVIIDDVAADKAFACHPTPAMYGFQSYISVPIIRRDGTFFGTLCAIDPKPAKVNNQETINLFTSLADLISMHISLIEQTVDQIDINVA